MRENEALAKQINGGSTDCAQACRESAQNVLRSRAEHLRRQAGQLHQEADRLEALARSTFNVSGPAEEALWALAINHIDRSAPRVF